MLFDLLTGTYLLSIIPYFSCKNNLLWLQSLNRIRNRIDLPPWIHPYLDPHWDKKLGPDPHLNTGTRQSRWVPPRIQKRKKQPSNHVKSGNLKLRSERNNNKKTSWSGLRILTVIIPIPYRSGASISHEFWIRSIRHRMKHLKKILKIVSYISIIFQYLKKIVFY